jgi:MscS family membrane protein
MKLIHAILGFLGAATLARGADVAAPAAPATIPANDLLEHFVDWLQLRMFPDGSHSEIVHWIACAVLFTAAILLRHVITNFIFYWLKKLAAKTETTLDDKLFPALEPPVATFVMVAGIAGALSVLKLSPMVDRLVASGARISILAVVFWGILRAGGAVLDHFEEIAHEKQIGLAHFMPLIKKVLAVLVVVFGVLMGAKSQGIDVGAVLTGLGIGGLAVAFAAQDTIANLFGSFVVAIDQPFKVGETVRIGGNLGTIEDIGLRSTKLRALDKSLVVLPNKTVAAETVTNLSRFTARRVEQVLGLTYDTHPDQMAAVVEDIRQLILREEQVDPASVMVFFRDYSASSLDIWVVYVIRDADFQKHMALRQKLNLAFMRAVEARGLAFAFPTQTMHLPGPLVEKLAAPPPTAKA